MTIANLITAKAKCTKCGASYGGCDCWVKLKCPTCGKTRMVERDNTDPPNTAEVHCTCDECDKGDFAEVLYFDRNGEQILEF